MGDVFGGDGVFTAILERFDPAYRPLVELGIFVLLLAAAVSTALNPVLDLLHRIWRFLTWLWRAIKNIFPKPAPPPPPSPGRSIPEEKTIWERQTPAQLTFPQTTGVPIIVVAAQKGGVGKSTISANLAIHFRRSRSKPVLLIDVDYQGSLSEMIRGEAGYSDRDMTADVLIRPLEEFPSPELYSREMRRGLEDVFLYPADYPLATIENDLMAEWISSENDLMYRLCKHLRRPEFQDRYCAVIIDSPPRMTAGAINAICGSTHLLVPTTLDDMSAHAAEYFLTQVKRMQDSICPRLKVIGIVPSIIARDTSYQLQEQRALDRLKQFGSDQWSRTDFVLEEGRVPRRAEIARTAGLGVASLRSAHANQIFERLGRAVEARL